MCIALVGNTGEMKPEWRETMTRAGFGLWLVQDGQVGATSRTEGLKALMIMADGVSGQEKDQTQERCAPASCVNCEGASLCRTMPALLGNSCCLS